MLAFSAKYQMDGMSGQFSPAVQAQIDGQSTAPLAGSTPTASSPSSPSTSASKGSSTGPSATATGTRAAVASASATGAGNGAIALSVGNSNLLLGVLGGIAAGAMLL
ncbi:hypothetical protein Moror_14217 [Moniliophthora roreri MCA 2997]|uniref:Uncharacterized protein n=1 Tax=Moniliophthora roreri (strain MCA 2997) TaxID=1381753 RepID=V2YT40_MONRO|nr:hypothetical protein Moror_14217 [Moniliophthora roreri MCA 2997]